MTREHSQFVIILIRSLSIKQLYPRVVAEKQVNLGCVRWFYLTIRKDSTRIYCSLRIDSDNPFKLLFQYLSIIVIGVGIAFSTFFHIMVSESGDYVERKQSEVEAENQVDNQQDNLKTEQRTIKEWLTLKRFYLVSWLILNLHGFSEDAFFIIQKDV